MADLVLTPANVAQVGTGTRQEYTAGETLVAGDICYVDSTTNAAYKAEADSTENKATTRGIALNGASTGQPVSLLHAPATVSFGALGLTFPSVFILSDNAGKIAAYADLAVNSYMSIIGYSISATSIRLLFTNTSVKRTV